MKNVRVFTFFALAALLLLVSSMPLSAGAARATVPFAFEVGGKTMPAGEYRFVCPTGSQIMQVIGEDGAMVQTFVREDGQNPNQTQGRLRFDKSGSIARLSSVVVYGRAGFRTVTVR